MVDQLASDYASQPVVFLEQNYYQSIGDRVSYFWTAHGGGSAAFPMIIVDSGHQMLAGSTSYYQTYKQKVDAELSRPPQAEVQATYTRIGNHLHFEVSVTNLSGVILSSSNKAKVHVIVYENNKISLTSRYVRAEVDTYMTTPLPDGSAKTYTLDTADLTGVDWGKLHSIAVVDYLPSGSSAYDMLQAAEAVAVPEFSITSSSLSFIVDALHPVDKTAMIGTRGISGVTWTAAENIPWLSLASDTGQPGEPIVVQVSAGGLAPGLQTGTIQVYAFDPGLTFSQDIPVTVYYGMAYYVLLPLAIR